MHVTTRSGRKPLDATSKDAPESAVSDTAITAKFEVPDRPRFQLVSPDAELLARINQLLAETGDHMSAVGLRDAGASLLGEAPPIVVVDFRYQSQGADTLAALCRARPGVGGGALRGGAPLRDLFRAGVLSITAASPETVVACVRSVARQRRYLSNESAIAEGVRASLARLRRIIVDLRSGLLATSVSVNLLNVVAEYSTAVCCSCLITINWWPWVPLVKLHRARSCRSGRRISPFQWAQAASSTSA